MIRGGIAVDQEKIVQRSREFKEGLAGTGSHIILEGTLPVMVSAPHAVSQLRRGRIKQSESYTGVLAELLSEAGIHAIIKTQNLDDDANYDSVSGFRRDLAAYIAENDIICLIDLHIMKASREHTVETAVDRGANIQDDWRIIELLRKAAADAEIGSFANDTNFRADNPNCIGADISRSCGIPAVQMEINWRYMNAEDNMEGFRKVYRFLLDALLTIAKERGRT